MAEAESQRGGLRSAATGLAAAVGLLQVVCAVVFALQFTMPFLAVTRWFEKDGGSPGDRLANGLAFAVLAGVLVFSLACGATGLGLLGLAVAIRRRGGAPRVAVLSQAAFTLPVPLVLLALPDLTALVARSLAMSVDVTRGAGLAVLGAQLILFTGALALGPRHAGPG